MTFREALQHKVVAKLSFSHFYKLITTWLWLTFGVGAIRRSHKAHAVAHAGYIVESLRNHPFQIQHRPVAPRSLGCTYTFFQSCYISLQKIVERLRWPGPTLVLLLWVHADPRPRSLPKKCERSGLGKMNELPDWVIAFGRWVKEYQIAGGIRCAPRVLCTSRKVFNSSLSGRFSPRSLGYTTCPSFQSC